jgi:hypothetical protein
VADLSNTICGCDGSGHQLVPYIATQQSNITRGTWYQCYRTSAVVSGGGKSTHLFTKHWHRRDSVEQCRCTYVRGRLVRVIFRRMFAGSRKCNVQGHNAVRTCRLSLSLRVSASRL